MNRLLVDLSWASSRLEGNAYSRLDTQNLIESGQVAKGKDAQETQMILNHQAAIEMLIEDAEQVGFDAFTFQNLHAVLSQNLLRKEAACGRLRRRPVEISAPCFSRWRCRRCCRTAFGCYCKRPMPFLIRLSRHLPNCSPTRSGSCMKAAWCAGGSSVRNFWLGRCTGWFCQILKKNKPLTHAEPAKAAIKTIVKKRNGYPRCRRGHGS